MIRFILLLGLVLNAISDCPLVPYPRSTVLGFVDAQFNNDPALNGVPQEYSYTLKEQFQSNGINVAVGVVGLQLNSHNRIDFYVEYSPSTQFDTLKFRVNVNDPLFGWRSLRFNFFATQNHLFQTSIESVSQFSVGLEEGKYSIYRLIPNFNAYSIEPTIRLFLSGLKADGKPLDKEYNTMLAQYQGFKKFSTNTKLINYFSEAIEQKKSLQIKIVQVRILGRLLAFNVITNTDLKNLRFSYILFSNKAVTEKHKYILGDFSLRGGVQYRFTPLNNMDMMITGLTAFKIPRDSLYNFNLAYNSYFEQSYFDVVTNLQFLELGFGYLALEMQQAYVCDDCSNSPVIYNDKFCVSMCPRGFSIIQRLSSKYCDKCDIEKLKVVDFNTGSCVCANRHYLDAVGDTCKPCTYDCFTCQRSDRCLTCDNKLMQTQRKMNPAGRCSCPPTGYYDDVNSQDIVCQKCHSSCVTCDGTRKQDCLTCSSGKELDSQGHCICSKGYVESPQGVCRCDPPKFLMNQFCIDNQVTCGANQVEQLVDLSRRCICKPGFIQVLNDCIQCGANSVFSNDELRCKCVNQTVEVNGVCLPCQVNQAFDSATGLCLCKPNTFKTDEGLCVTCPPKMAYLNGKCECIFNYFQVGTNVCQRCLKQTDGPKCRRNVE